MKAVFLSAIAALCLTGCAYLQPASERLKVVCENLDGEQVTVSVDDAVSDGLVKAETVEEIRARRRVICALNNLFSPSSGAEPDAKPEAEPVKPESEDDTAPLTG